jgi:hypothetical protein
MNLAHIASATAMSLQAMDDLEAACFALPEEQQIEFTTDHFLHEGVYYRTIMMPAGSVTVGLQILKPSTVVFSGKCRLLGEGDPIDVDGYRVFPTLAGRRTIVLSESDTYATMSYRTDARTVEEAEEELTKEPHRLGNRRYAQKRIEAGG